MMAPDFWSRLWLLVLTYPSLAFMLVVILCLVGTFIALALVSMSRPHVPLDQWEDDAEQRSAVSRPLPLETWGRSGGNWWGKP